MMNKVQEGIVVGAKSADELQPLPLAVSSSLPKPELRSEHDVLVRVLAVALNPTDFKMVSFFSKPGDMVGCDFCGIVEDQSFVAGTNAAITPGTRICGGGFPYNPGNPTNGSFAQYVVADSRVVLVVPDEYDDLQAASLGAVGWGTAGLAFWSPEALNLEDLPSKPSEKGLPVLIYGGATASGTMACQLLKHSGYAPIAVCSEASASFVMSYGAVGTVSYTSTKCAEEVKALAGEKQIRKALDCITSIDSVATCMAALARTGGRYACLDALNPSWPVRRAVRSKVVMGYEGLGIRIDLGDSPYTREANPQLFEVTVKVTREMQKLVNDGAIKTHPLRELSGRWQGIIDGLELLRQGKVSREKLVVRISS